MAQVILRAASIIRNENFSPPAIPDIGAAVMQDNQLNPIWQCEHSHTSRYLAVGCAKRKIIKFEKGRK